MDQKDKIFLLITKNRSALMAVIVAMTRDFDAAEDIFQDTVLEIIRHADRYQPDREFLPWARGIARNMVRRFYRLKAKNPALMSEEQMEAVADVICAEDDKPEAWEEVRTALQVCLQRLTERNRKIFLLRYGLNLKSSALAERAGAHQASLRTTLMRIRQFLRKCINSNLKVAGAAANG